LYTYIQNPTFVYMEVNVLMFGIAKDIVGGQFHKIGLPRSATVHDLKRYLCDNFEKFNDLASLAVAVNNEYAENDQVLKPEDEIAIIPPVSGG